MENNIINSIEYKKYNTSYEKEVINIFVKAFEIILFLKLLRMISKQKKDIIAFIIVL